MGIQRIQKRRYQIGQATQVAQIPRTARGLYQADRSEEKEKTRELPPLQKKESPGVKEANSGAQHERAKKKAKLLGKKGVGNMFCKEKKQKSIPHGLYGNTVFFVFCHRDFAGRLLLPADRLWG